ncbi:ADP-ribosylglycohydrolase family protein [Dactylosporangium sp. NPDC049742]|uniref:ADP-ribosylglycohydrolase family protein n=1 Tax=Dactylosporangium sp. NPDC049742 TaxID=3154737 RepID=UPI0034480F18
MRFALTERVRLGLVDDSLAGLSVGDALGAQFFMVGRSVGDLVAGRVPDGPWEWTDDTHMACSVVTELRDGPAIDQDRLAARFSLRYESHRGYGAGAATVLHEIREGVPWREAARRAFGEQGSLGNGGAMRVAPVGAYHADRPARAAEQAARSAEVTHAHPDGVAGAVVVAVAAAHAAAARLGGARPEPRAFLELLRPHTPGGAVERGLTKAGRLIGRTAQEAAYDLGNGSRVTAQDTVPFAVWVAATHLADYPAAVTACVLAGGDIDTTAAIAGGIVAAYTGVGERTDTGAGVPPSWIDAREPLPDWAG